MSGQGNNINHVSYVVDKALTKIIDGFVLLVYDLPKPEKIGDTQLKRKINSIYNKYREKLAKLGTPINYSTIVIPRHRIKEVLKIRREARKEYESVGIVLKDNDIRVVEFESLSEKTAYQMLQLIRDKLRSWLVEKIELIESKLREAVKLGRYDDLAKLHRDMMKVMSELSKMDWLGLRQYDPEIAKLVTKLQNLIPTKETVEKIKQELATTR